jgi:SAM-dependent methyltransferase
MPYSSAYFDKWYRSEHRVHSPADRMRTVRMVVGVADYMLGRPIRSVLDIGAGEGQWLGALRRIHGAIRYAGVDPSEYAVARYGRRRNIRSGSLGNLPREVTRRSYDLVVCSGVLNYLPPAELRAGLARVAQLARGVAFLELFTDRDDVQGDTRGRRRGTFYRSLLRDLGFRQCGPHCYVGRGFEGGIVEMEIALK